MSTINTIKTAIKNLDLSQLEDLSSYIFTELLNVTTEINDDIHFNNVCPNCGSIECVKNGKVRGKQRFLCRDCYKTFGLNSKSVIANTKIPHTRWLKYINCMINGFSIRKSAEIAEVCVKTSFYMRHKILDSLNEFMNRGNVSGIVEMDETFLAESFKGNHKKSGFEMPRTSRKRGKEITKRGISSEQICIGTAIDKNNNIIIEMVCKGRVTSKKLNELYNGFIAEDSIICTDSLSSYRTLSQKLNLKHKPVATGRRANGIFNLSRINSLHSKFKTWIRRFNGVSTKFLPNYLKWFKWLEQAKNLREHTKVDKMFNDAMAKIVDVRISAIKQREAVFI
jgi:transposase-like protein